MVQVQIVSHPAFYVAGICTWIDELDDFGAFWAHCGADGTTERLAALQGGVPGPVTQARLIGVSRVEKDPQKRKFNFSIASEVGEEIAIPRDFERFLIPAATWAVCTGEGEMMQALYEAEMHAFGVLLQSGTWEHAPVPELEVYPADDGTVQFWLPVIPSGTGAP